MNQATDRSINPLKARLTADRPCVGLLISMPSPHVVQVLAAQGFDWLFFDMEHGPINLESTHAMITATRGTRTAPIVRVPWNLHWLVKPVLDAGAMGVIFPMIRGRAEAAAAARSVRYPPAGERGFGPFYAALRFGLDMKSYVDPADEEILCILLIEHKDAIEDIDNIVQVPGVDACLIAPFDLAMSYGYRDGPDHPVVQEGIAKAEQAIRNSPVHLGGLALDNARAQHMITRGYRLILTGFDTLLLERGAAAILNGIGRDD